MELKIVKRKLASDLWIFYFTEDCNDRIRSSYYFRYKKYVSKPSVSLRFCERLFWYCKNLPEKYKRCIINMFFTERQLVNINSISFYMYKKAYLKWLEEDGNDDYKETRF